ncbi:hypothetical protein EDB19DRAFT_1906503 [Suillus lakei]|nr:hypothetical protein EDB19DRAFT_1906503 [Suillus lakei]
MVNQPTANDTTSLAESTSTHSDVSSSPQSIAENTAKHVKLIIPQVKATPSELHSAAPEVIDVDVDENNTAPALTTICDNRWRIPRSRCNGGIPATSTAVERVFSQGRHLLHFTRNPSSTRAFLCLGSWLRCDLFAPEDLTNIMKSLGGRKREDKSVSDFKKRVKARNEKWNDSELLKMAGADLMINYPANSFVADVDLGYLTSLEARILENSEEAGIADNQQWGLDAGQHQRRWDVYLNVPNE